MASINKTFVPPHSMEAERAVLGAILRNPNEFNVIVDRTRLDAKHFYADSHRMTYSTMQALEQANQPIDLLRLTEKLFKDQNKQAFNPTYIIELTESCPVAQNVEYYARIVRENITCDVLLMHVIPRSKKQPRPNKKLLVLLKKSSVSFLKSPTNKISVMA